jgi:FxsC-like protein
MLHFFLSYSRNNNDEHLRGFFHDLAGAINDRTGLVSSGFIDQEGNEPGDMWEPNLEAALATARVFVAVTTASYCQKPYCGKEWAAFHDRIRRYRRAASLDAEPPLLMTLLWVPPDASTDVPDVISSRHFHIGDPDAAVNRKGLKSLVKLKARFVSEYDEVIDCLATRILELSNAHRRLDEVDTVPSLRTVASAFTQVSDTAASSVPPLPRSATVGGPNRVHFIYGAPSPADAHAHGRRFLELYGAAGGAEWRPFFPSVRTVGAMAQNVASSDQLNMMSSELPLTADLADQVRRLERDRQLVVMLLDRWAAQVPGHAAALRSFDDQNYVNCSVLIPHNHDAESAACEQALALRLRQTLRHWVDSRNSLHLRAGIGSEDDFRLQLQDVLTRLRAEVITDSDASSPLPAGGARPTISATGG